MHVLVCFFFLQVSGAIDNCSTLCLDDPALQTLCLRQYVTVPCRLPAIITERGYLAKESPVHVLVCICSNVRQFHRDQCSDTACTSIGLYFVNAWASKSYSTDWTPKSCHPLFLATLLVLAAGKGGRG